MDSRWSLLVLLVLAGCGPKACGRSTPVSSAGPPDAAPVAAAPAPPAPAPPEPLEVRLAQKHFVIVHSSPIPRAGASARGRLIASGLAAEVLWLSSIPYASLRPCLEVVVAGAFSDVEAARALSQRLAEAGIPNYLKHAGPLAADREQREVECRRQEEVLMAPPRTGASGPRFLDLRGPRTFVLLSDAPQDIPGAQLRQVGQDRGFWMAELKQDPTGTFKKGDAFDVYDAQGPIKVACRVKGFASLNRGVPHFSYFQQPEEPADPGCGKAWPVAELDCSLTNTRAQESNLAFVLPKGSPAPRYFPPSQALPEPLKEAQESALRALPAYRKTRAAAQAHAGKQGAVLSESLEWKAFPAGERQVVVGLAHFETGKGNSQCGGPDYQATVSRVVAVASAEGRGAPVGGALDGESILAVMDLEGDGSVELLTRSRTDASRVALVREDGSRITATFLPHCDTSC
ncbi:MAG TPA: hypothetical protein VF815_12255 [Myxococcaceae bacterium]